jgi:hypothetical protein
MTFDFKKWSSELSRIRVGECSDDYLSSGYSITEAAALTLEVQIRTNNYHLININSSDHDHPWLGSYLACYRGLFLDPFESDRLIPGLLKALPDGLKDRARIWEAHVACLLGRIDEARPKFDALLESRARAEVWDAELFACLALFRYFDGKLEAATEAHAQSDRSCEISSDIFVRIFNASMALRTALMRGDVGMFRRNRRKLWI